MPKNSLDPRFSRRQWLQGAAALPLAAWLVACEQKSQQPVAPSSNAAPAPGNVADAGTQAAAKKPEMISMRVGINPWPGVMPLKTAEHDGLFKTHGLDMQLTLFASISQMMEAFNAGRVDATIIDPGTLLVSAAGGVPQKFVFVTDFSNGADAVVAHPSIQSVKEFKGKKISVEMGSIGHFLLLTALKQNGLSVKDVTLINQTADAALAAFAAGKTKIAVSYEPFISQVTGNGKGKVLFSTREVAIAPDVMSARQEFLDKHPEAIPRFIKTWYSVLKARERKMEEAVAIESKALEVSGEDYKSFSGGVRIMSDPKEVEAYMTADSSAVGLNKTSVELAAFLKEQKLLDKDPPAIETLIDPSYLRKYVSESA